MKKIRNEFRKHLELEYINEKKAEEYEAKKKQTEATRETDGYWSVPMMHDEIVT